MAADLSRFGEETDARRAFTRASQGHIFAPPRQATTTSRLGGAVLERLLSAAINTWNGLVAATRSEEAFRQELVILGLAIPLAFVITEGSVYALTLIAMVLMVMI